VSGLQSRSGREVSHPERLTLGNLILVNIGNETGRGCAYVVGKNGGSASAKNRTLLFHPVTSHVTG